MGIPLSPIRLKPANKFAFQNLNCTFEAIKANYRQNAPTVVYSRGHLFFISNHVYRQKTHFDLPYFR